MLALLLLACISDRTQSRGHPPPGYTVHGIDVSHHQGWIDWDAVERSGIGFAFVKATQGTTHTDRRFHQNRRAAERRMPIGAYHYFSACSPGREQATHFIDVVGSPTELPAVLDVEVDEHCNRPDALDAARDDIDAWLDEVEQAFGTRPLVYASRHYEARALDGVDASRWIASYGRRPRRPWRFWQYTSTGRVPGIAGDVDRNVYSEAELP